MMVTWAIARTAVTWAIARKAVELILPMSLETLRCQCQASPASVATIACLRVKEMALLQVCDLWWDHLTSFGVTGF
jgi:hypothetical protein